MKLFFLFFLIGALGTSCHRSKSWDFVFIGLDQNGNEVKTMGNGEDYQKNLVTVMDRIDQSILPSLNNGPSLEKNVTGFELKQVDVGTYVKMQLGIGNFIKGTVEPFFKIYFTR